MTTVPVPLREPRAVLVTLQTYVIPAGHVELHVGIAVKVCLDPAAIEGVVGLNATELSVGATAEIVITVELPTVTAPSVAFT